MVVHSPIIVDWQQNKLDWQLLYQPNFTPFQIQPNSEVQLPYQDYIYKYPEGVLQMMAGVFDSPYCGGRIAYPGYDSKNAVTINNFVLFGNLTPNESLWVSIPPITPPGIYGFVNLKEYFWRETFRVWVTNTDPVYPHTCLTYVYQIAVLKQPRPKLSLTDLAEMTLQAEVDPDMKEKVTELMKLYYVKNMASKENKVKE